MNEALLLTCDHCGNRVRLREGEEAGRCEACNAVVGRRGPKPEEGQGLTPTVVLIGSLLLMVAGAVAFRAFRRQGVIGSHSTASVSTAPPLSPAPPLASSDRAPAGEIAWATEARAPVVLSADADDVEDIFGFFRVWDGLSAWTYHGGVFDGKTLAPVWRSEPIDPQILKRAGVVPTAISVGKRVVVADATPLLRVFEAGTGDKVVTLRMADAVVDMCRAADPAARIWVQVVGDQHALIDLDTGKATFAPRPAWCTLADTPRSPVDAGTRRRRGAESEDAPATSRACVDDFRNRIARAACLPGDDAPVVDGVSRHYLLKDGSSAVVLATKDERPVAVGVGSGYKATWSVSLVADDSKPAPEAPRIADLAGGRVYAVYAMVYFDSRLVALDAETGARIWDVALVGSMASTSLGDLGRGEARGLVSTPSRVYVTRSGGGLDVFEAATGAAVGTIGKK